jgi:hypothetical protein
MVTFGISDTFADAEQRGSKKLWKLPFENSNWFVLVAKWGACTLHHISLW